jgi:hypothetical protein
VQSFSNSVDSGQAPELQNAAHLIASVQRSNQYQWGTGYWNSVIKRFVPGQWVGRDLKRSLLIQLPRQNITGQIFGTTITGIGDAFEQLGYLGSAFFALVGIFFKNLWSFLERSRNPVFQIGYAVAVVTALRCITHETTDFLPGIIYAAIFLGLVAYYSRSQGITSQNIPWLKSPYYSPTMAPTILREFKRSTKIARDETGQ